LATARSDELIYNRGGRGLFIIGMDGEPTTTLIRFNDIASPLYEVRRGYIKGAFQRIYLTNAAEAGKTLKFVVGHRNFAEFMLLDPAQDSTLLALIATIAPVPTALPTLYSKTMTLADTEYEQGLGVCKGYSIHTRDDTAFRLAFETGKVAVPAEPYKTVPANTEEYKDGINAAITLYFACAGAGKIAEIERW